MSEQPTATARPSGGRILGMRPGTFYLVAAGVALVGGLAYFWLKNRNAGAATAASGTASTTATSGTDYSGELSVIQSELEALLQQQGGGTTTGTTGTTGTTTTTTGTPVIVNVPDGSGKWMQAAFPSQAALNSFVTALHLTPAPGAGPAGPWYWPGGLTNQQVTSAVTQAGGSVGAGGLSGFEPTG